MPIKNGLSVDVEDYFHAEAITETVGRDTWNSCRAGWFRTHIGFLIFSASTMFARLSFILGWVAERFPLLVKDIQARGHEIGCHSYWHRLIYDLTSEEFREDTHRAKDTIESAAGVEIIGYRAPSFSLTERSQWALEILQELGFQYDSSIFPIHHDRYGFPGHSRFPCNHGKNSSWNILEMPISTWRVGSLNLPFGGGGYLRILPLAYTRLAFRSVNERDHQPVIVYFHPWEIDPDQPRVKVPFRSRFRHYTNLGSMKKRIGALLRIYEFVPLRDLLEFNQIPAETF